MSSLRSLTPSPLSPQPPWIPLFWVSERPDRGVAEAWREEEVLPWTGPHTHTDSEAMSIPATWLARLHLWPLSPGDSPVGLL